MEKDCNDLIKFKFKIECKKKESTNYLPFKMTAIWIYYSTIFKVAQAIEKKESGPL